MRFSAAGASFRQVDEHLAAFKFGDKFPIRTGHLKKKSFCSFMNLFGNVRINLNNILVPPQLIGLSGFKPLKIIKFIKFSFNLTF